MLEVEEKSLVSQYNMKLSGRRNGWLWCAMTPLMDSVTETNTITVVGRSRRRCFAFNFNQALTFAEADLKANWTIYRERFLKGR
jgi:hypothetical protein